MSACPDCSGSGEGLHEGNICPTCDLRAIRKEREQDDLYDYRDAHRADDAIEDRAAFEEQYAEEFGDSESA